MSKKIILLASGNGSNAENICNYFKSTDDFTKFEEWDSLKHLEVITLLDKIIGKKIKKIKNISQITKLKKILALAKK